MEGGGLFAVERAAAPVAAPLLGQPHRLGHQVQNDRAVCDYIAGMTDPFAVDRFQELFIPKGWTVL